MTGEPSDWVGHTAEELRTGLGEPHRTVPEKNGGEIWEYYSQGTFVREHMSPGDYQNVTRYQIREGKVKHWFIERYENGIVVQRDH
ncbi:MAG TPA: hypothetical protein VK633_12915 [Verrucomicrobiae bacterium]|nr:hypothetical protein [Verrucomicrobiae bacterium]